MYLMVEVDYLALVPKVIQIEIKPCEIIFDALVTNDKLKLK